MDFMTQGNWYYCKEGWTVLYYERRYAAYSWWNKGSHQIKYDIFTFHGKAYSLGLHTTFSRHFVLFSLTKYKRHSNVNLNVAFCYKIRQICWLCENVKSITV